MDVLHSTPRRDGRSVKPSAKPSANPPANTSAQQALQQALALHRQGDLAAAARLYASVLMAEPECADALHLLGVLKGQLGETAVAIQLIERAIARSPRSSPYHNNLGNLLKASGDSVRARESYRQAIRCDAANAEAHLNLGRLLCDLGDLQAARASLHKALRLAPNLLEAHLSLARVEESSGATKQAITATRNAIRLAPTHPPAHLVLGKLLTATGELDEAIAAFRRALELAPDYADATFNLGTALYAQAQHAAAIEAFRRAIELAPPAAPEAACDAWNNLGLCLSALDRSDEAIAAFERALALKPDYDGACLNLAKEHIEQRALDRARPLLERAIRINPQRTELYLHLGTLEENSDSLDRAAATYRQAIEALGPSSELESRLGLALARMGEQQGIDLLARLVAEEPDSAEANFHLGTALLFWVQQQWEPEADRARGYLQRALALNPTHADALLNLGVLEERDGNLAAAADLYRCARRQPNPSLDLLNNLGGVLNLQGDPEGVAILQQNVLDHPDYAEAHFSLATALLLEGRYREGWAEYEWRRKVERLRSNCRLSTLPDWRGEPLANPLGGRPILLYSEQGFGDTLQFARYVPLVAASGGMVVLDVQPPLRRLLQHLPGVAVCVDEEEDRLLPACHFALPLLSLPRLFDTTLETIPDGVILNVPPASASECPLEPCLRVGLVWAGNPRHQRDRLRSVPLANLLPLAGLDGVEFVSLQTGPAAAQTGRFPFVADCTAVKDFADTAQIIATLDLVITIDSAVAHLAGAMGKPVWILLANAPDWRWGLHTETTPWYRTARLFRQRTPHDWREVIAQVTTELAKEIAQRQSQQRPGTASMPAITPGLPAPSTRALAESNPGCAS